MDQPTYVFEADRPPFAADRFESAGAAHDLGNLIQIATSALNRLGRSSCLDGDPALAGVVASAKAALRQAGVLLRREVRAPSIPAPALRKAHDLLDVSACVGEILALIRWVCEPDVRLLVDAPTGLPRVRCSGLDLQNAVLNLAINARDAMPEGGVLSLCVQATRPEVVELRIADTGVGMTPATLQRALDPFFTTKADGRGAGLGLAMVQRFAADSEGRLEIASRPGEGATVTLRLPTDDADPLASWAVDLDR